MEHSKDTRLDLRRRDNYALERPHRVNLSHPLPAESNQSLDISLFWETLRKYRWGALATFAVVLAWVATWTLLQTPVYRAQGLLEIEKESPHVPTAQDLFTLDSVSDVYLETQYRLLESPTLADQVIHQLALADMPEFAPPQKPPFWRLDKTIASFFASPQGSAAVDPNSSETTLDAFREHLQITPIRHSRLIQISFDSADPRLAVRVVNAFVSSYIEHDAKARGDESQKATKWLSQQLADVTAQLQDAENKLQSYARGNGLMLPDIGGGGNETLVADRLRKFQEELTKARAERNDKESQYRLVQAGDYASLPGIFESKLIQDLSIQLAELQKQSALLKTNFSPEYFKVKEVQNQIAEIEAALNRERGRAAQSITQNYTAAVNHEDLARHDFEEQSKQASLVGERLTQFNRLKGEVDADRKLHEDLLQRVKQARFSAEASAVRIVDSARPAHTPIRPRVALNLGLGAFFGILLGIGFAFIRENADHTVHNPEQVEEILSLPTLAFVPTIESLNDRMYTYKSDRSLSPPRTMGTHNALSLLPDFSPKVDSDTEWKVVLSEAFRSLSTSMLFSAARQVPTSILVTSAQPGEGKTMVAANLAISLAELGQPVLLIDADLRRPKIHRIFGIRGQTGLVGYLTGEYDWRDAIQKTGVHGLDVLHCGSQHSNPVHLLASEAVPKLLAEAAKVYKYIVLDSPPVLSVADARILAHLVEGVMLVVKSSGTPRLLMQRAESSIRGAGARIIGVVLNNFDYTRDSYYSGRSSPYDYALQSRAR